MARPKTRHELPGGPISGPLYESIEAAIAAGRTPYAIAQAAGIGPNVLSRFRSGERSLQLGSADALARSLGLRLAASAPKKRGRPAKGSRMPQDDAPGEDR